MSPHLRGWRPKGRSRAEALASPLVEPADLVGLLDAGVNRRDSDGSVIPELGARWSAWNGNTALAAAVDAVGYAEGQLATSVIPNPEPVDELGRCTVWLPAREEMTVYWEGEEAAGFIVFALSRPTMERSRDLHEFGWPVEPDVRPSALIGERWKVAVWYVRVVTWPTRREFQGSIGRVLCGLVDEGYSVAWIGVEGSFVDPPGLFLPEAMPGGAPAACSAETGVLVAVDIDEPLRALSDSEMLRLREASGGFASAES